MTNYALIDRLIRIKDKLTDRNERDAINDACSALSTPAPISQMVGAKPIALISEGTLRHLLQDTGGRGMSDRIEAVAAHIVLMSARGDIAPISAQDALNIAEAVSPCRGEILAVLTDFVTAIDTKHGWHVRSTLEGALAAIPAPRGGLEPNWWDEWVKTTLAYNALAKAAQAVIDEAEAIHDNDPWPTRYRAPYEAITKLSAVLEASDKSVAVAPSPAERGE